MTPRPNPLQLNRPISNATPLTRHFRCYYCWARFRCGSPRFRCLHCHYWQHCHRHHHQRSHCYCCYDLCSSASPFWDARASSSSVVTSFCDSGSCHFQKGGEIPELPELDRHTSLHFTSITFNYSARTHTRWHSQLVRWCGWCQFQLTTSSVKHQYHFLDYETRQRRRRGASTGGCPSKLVQLVSLLLKVEKWRERGCGN